jgi:hypothetical protein
MSQSQRAKPPDADWTSRVTTGLGWRGYIGGDERRADRLLPEETDITSIRLLIRP